MAFDELVAWFPFDVMPRVEFGVPAPTPFEVCPEVRPTYYVPPLYCPLFRKLGDATHELRFYMDRLMDGEMTFHGFVSLRSTAFGLCFSATSSPPTALDSSSK